MLVDLIYCHMPCPKCGKNDLPLRAWIVEDDFDEDGHANGRTVEVLDCQTCGELLFDDNGDPIAAAIREIEKAYWEDNTIEVGTIREYWQELGLRDVPNKTWSILVNDVRLERAKQHMKWGVQNHSPARWLAILVEEVGEVGKAVVEDRLFDVRIELVQVAAVAVAAIESLDRNELRRS